MAAFLPLTSIVAGQGDPDFLNGLDCKILRDQRYGPDERNTFDIIMPRSAVPTPLVIFYHGGGFEMGDKKDAWWLSLDIRQLLENGIAFATANYRFRKSDDSLGVRRCLEDGKNLLQYIRHHAEEFNINPEAVGCTGSSAGAGISLWLAFHDDMAVKGDSTLLGESTRISCVGALETQATYNLFRWREFIPGLWLESFLLHRFFFNSAAGFYGFRDYRSFKPCRATVTRELDMLGMIDPSDPPAFIRNTLRQRFPKDMIVIQHHRAHALELGKTLKKNGVPHTVSVWRRNLESAGDKAPSLAGFLIEHLK